MRMNCDESDFGVRKSIFGRSDTGIAARLGTFESRLTNLSSHASTLELERLVCGTRMFERDHFAVTAHGDLENIFVLEQGWACKLMYLTDGRRHISEFFGPGAICNWSRLSDFEEQDDILFKSGASVCMLDASSLGELLEKRQELAAIIKQHETERTKRTAQRVRAVISLPATEKLLFLLLDLDNEAMAAGRDPIWMELPFSQIEIGDILGLTPVHVSRTFTKLEEDGVIARDGRHIRFADVDELRKSLSYRQFFIPAPQN